MKNYMTGLVVGSVVLFMAIFVAIASYTDSFLAAVIVTPFLSFYLIKNAWMWLERRFYKALRNRHKSFHVVGCYPKGLYIPSVTAEPGDAPNLGDYNKECIFVPYKEVQVLAAEIRKEIKRANKGIPTKDQHPIQVYTYSFREPVSEEAVLEKWEGEENSYVNRVVSSIKEVLCRETVDQYNAGKDAYRKIEMGQIVEW